MTQPLYGAMPTSSSIKRRQRLSDALLSQATDASPVGHWSQALARGLNGYLAGRESRLADKEEGQRSQALANALSGDMSPSEMENFGAVNDMPQLIDMGQSRRRDQQWQQGFDADQAYRGQQQQNWQQGFNADNAYRNNNLALEREKFDWQKNAPPDPTDDQREYQYYVQQEAAAGRQPVGFMDYMTGIKRAGASNVNVNSGENAYDKEVGGYWGKTFGSLNDSGRAAQDQLNSLAAMENMTNDQNFYSGFGAPQLLSLKKAAVAMGADPNSVTNIESFNALARKSALDSMGGSLGTGFSNADRDFVTGMTASQDNTPAGNRAVIGVNRRIAQRKIEIAQRARDYAATHNGRLDPGFETELRQWAEQNPLFPQAPDGSGQQGQSQPQNGGYKILGVEDK